MNAKEQFSEFTLEITKSLTKKEKQDFGIFITPKIIIERLFQSLISFIKTNELDISRILEPSCGSCEIIHYCNSVFENVEIHGIEYNDKIFDHIKKQTFENNVKLIHQNFMLFQQEENYDLIVGNPPYFVCTKKDIPSKYHGFCVGRPNIFGGFIVHSLTMLNNGGVLAFIIPKSFLNSSYYSAIRDHIKRTCKIIDILDFKEYDDFMDTKQATFGLILQKSIEESITEECNFSLKINQHYIFTTNKERLNAIFENSTTLEKLGLKVRTGSVVWNEHKDELTEDTNTLLIYNTNISNENQLVLKQFKNEEKKQFIRKRGKTEYTLVVNRGNGNSDYKLNYALIEGNRPYLIENHLNEIYFEKQIPKDEMLKIYGKIINSFKNPKTQQFIQLFLGNNGLSKTELETIFPIYDVV